MTGRERGSSESGRTGGDGEEDDEELADVPRRHVRVVGGERLAERVERDGVCEDRYSAISVKQTLVEILRAGAYRWSS